jgi:hypothetical protein
VGSFTWPGTRGDLNGRLWALGSPAGLWVDPLGLLRVPLRVPGDSQEPPVLGGPLEYLGGFLGPPGVLQDQVWRSGGIIKLLVYYVNG